ncbi:putative pyridoxine 5'-phosphate oxidase superfamily flavin-nucleotide-binding protein [Rhodoligotrophos appendicifer]
MIADRPRNNRVDGLRNLLHDPNVGLIFLIPGMRETLRINGYASITADPALLADMAKDGAPAKAIRVVHVEGRYPLADLRSVASLWSQWYFLALLVPTALSAMLLGRSPDPGLKRLRLFLDPQNDHPAAIGFDGAILGAECMEDWLTTVIGSHLQPFI